MTPDQFEDVKADIYAEPWKAPGLIENFFHHVVTELGKVATVTGDDGPLRLADGYRFHVTPAAKWWADDLLFALQDHARSGVPFGEPYDDQPPTVPEDL